MTQPVPTQPVPPQPAEATRLTGRTRPGGRIVVGVDGSPGSEKALRRAITQARLADADVEAVASWQDPVASGYYSFGFQHAPCPVVVVPTDPEASATSRG